MTAPAIERFGHGVQGIVWLVAAGWALLAVIGSFGILALPLTPLIVFAIWRTSRNWRFARRGAF